MACYSRDMKSCPSQSQHLVAYSVHLSCCSPRYLYTSGEGINRVCCGTAHSEEGMNRVYCGTAHSGEGINGVCCGTQWRRNEWGLLWHRVEKEWMGSAVCGTVHSGEGQFWESSQEEQGRKLQPRLWGPSVSITAMPVSPISSKRFKTCQRRMLVCDLETVLVTFWQRMSLLFAPVGDVYLRLKWRI